MDNSLAISLQNVSKKYRLFGSMKERFLEALHPFDKQYHKEFWALKDISFDVPKGTTVGIVGRNGSGKSTLLQIICSILQPTSGSIEFNGKISALLELGAGFNTELSGRENVLFQGEIMGFTRKEMLKRLPEIEAFADIGEFIDQPVKIYSSGMFVRLAFASAVSVDPDILIIDEALAVGDAKFQNKCYRKFQEFQEKGKTIVLVTHDMNAITRHCNHAILLEKGCIEGCGEPNEVTNQYFEITMMGESLPKSKVSKTRKSIESSPTATDQIHSYTSDLNLFIEEEPFEDKCQLKGSYNKNEYRFGDKRALIIDYLVVCDDQLDPIAVDTDATIKVLLKILFHEPVAAPMIGHTIKTLDGIVVYANNTYLHKTPIASTEKGDMLVYETSIKLSMLGGDYFISQGIGERIGNEYIPMDYRNDFIHLTIRDNLMDFRGLVMMDTKYSEVSRKLAISEGKRIIGG